MVRKALWIGLWCALLAGCGGAASESPMTAADATVGYAGAANDSAQAQAAPGVAAGEEVQLTGALAGAPAVRRQSESVEFSNDELTSMGPDATSAPARFEPQGGGGKTAVTLAADKKASAERSGTRLAQNAQPAPPPPASPASPVGQPKKDREQRADVEAVAQPMLVYTANMTMAVFEVKKSLSDVEALAREVSGFLSKRTDHDITIRVPVARFDEAIARLEKMGDVVARNVTAEDVTEEFFDLDVRLKSSRAVRERLEQLLQKATKVEDSVLIERELTRVVGEIERIEGRMKFLRDRASYSTITVVFQARGSERVGNGPFNLPVPWLNELGLRRLLSL